MKRWWRVLLLGLVLSSRPAVAQDDCECDHRLALEDTVVAASDLGVEPGDRVCVMAGERPFLRLRGFQGTADRPIEIVNCGGKAVIHNEDRAYALVMEEDSRHFHITGTGDAAHLYGFELSAPAVEPYPGVGLVLIGRSTNYEVDHVEIHDTGFAGVSAKTDPLCDGTADQGNFVQENVTFHHMWVHDTRGEGFYIGSTQSTGHTITCDGTQVVHQPHFLEGIVLRDTIIEDTGWDGAQIGMARARCEVARNTIRRVGLEGVEFQQQGLQIGTFSTCEVHHNIIQDGQAIGIFILEAGDMLVHSNLVTGFPNGDGIYANLRDGAPGARYRFYFNTIADVGDHALQVFGGGLGASEALNQLVIDPDDAPVAAGGDVDWSADANLVFESAAAAGIRGGGDYHLGASSAARGAGVRVSDLNTDLDGVPRTDPPSVGAYEWNDGPIPDAGPDGAGGGATSDGCGCRVAAPPTTPWPWPTITLAGVVLRRRRQRQCQRQRGP